MMSNQKYLELYFHLLCIFHTMFIPWALRNDASNHSPESTYKLHMNQLTDSVLYKYSIEYVFTFEIKLYNFISIWLLTQAKPYASKLTTCAPHKVLIWHTCRPTYKEMLRQLTINELYETYNEYSTCTMYSYQSNMHMAAGCFV